MGKQKRSENTYQKINSVFYRDENNIIMPYDELCDPVLQYLRDNNVKMYATEKIDGTNTRIEVTSSITEEGVEFTVAYKGKTDNANIPKGLQKVLDEKYPPEAVLGALGLSSFIPFSEFTEHNWVNKDNNGNVTGINVDKVPARYTIYGEGYGAKIQSGGRYLRDSNEFIVFDVKVDDMWLLPEVTKSIAEKLGAPYVPELGEMTIDEAISVCKNSPMKSRIAEDPTLVFEGIVLKTPLGLLDRRGERIICKVKVCDFQKYYGRYKTFDQVEQKRNPKANME